MYKFTIEYQYGSYKGTKTIYAETNEEAIRLMWSNFSRRKLLTLPMAYRSAKVIKVEDAEEA